MAIEIPGWREAASWRATRAIRVRFYLLTRKFSSYFRFNSITRRIIVLNLAGVLNGLKGWPTTTAAASAAPQA